MEILVAKSGGFCNGVRKAVDIALSVPPENVYLLSELIHNVDVLNIYLDDQHNISFWVS